MHISKPIKSWLRRYAKNAVLVAVAFAFMTCPAHANMIDAFNLAPFVPLVLETMMNMATSLYKYFVGNGTGLIYICIYVFLAFYLSVYLVKMHLPKDWGTFFGFSGGGEMWEKDIKPWTIAENVMKPCLRAIVAGFILLQIKPVYITEWLVNPFLEFGSIYTESILETANKKVLENVDAPACPASIAESGWISERSCNFLVRPVYVISQENNRVIKYGFDFMVKGLTGLMTPIPRGGEDLMNLITGILLLFAFVSANVFMALLIIQAIFDFCIALIMYPFNVLAWVAKKSDKWMDFLPAFSQIIDALKKLVITMIACAFILCINIAIVQSLFNWSSSIFTNPTAATMSITNPAMNFGQHSILWLSALLTFFLMHNIFKMTRERLDMYTGNASHGLYDSVTGDAKIMWDKIKATPDTIKNIWSLGEKMTGKK